MPKPTTPANIKTNAINLMFSELFLKNIIAITAIKIHISDNTPRGLLAAALINSGLSKCLSQSILLSGWDNLFYQKVQSVKLALLGIW
jgi:hypothetical protein